MIDNPFRKILPHFVGPLLSTYKILRLSPNGVTILGCLFGLLSAYFVSQGLLFDALLIWWSSRLLDGTDGIYARQINQSSNRGAFLDINCDMLAYSAMIIGFHIYAPVLALQWSVILLLYVLCISGALSLGSMQEKDSFQGNHKDNRKLHLAAGLAEGGETGIFYSLCLLLPQHLTVLVNVWIIILIVTILARLVLAMKLLKGYS